jgi:16S rRNA (guanine966-N2)-methyltransferase
VRVVGGSLGGRRLLTVPGKDTRPTSDRVREALFATLGERVEGARVLDLFAGTGALGIEALSRGAAAVVFVERDRAAIVSLGENLASLGIGPDAAAVRRMEALAALRSARGAKETYDLLFIDPPYGTTRRAGSPRWERELADLLMPLLAPGARIVVESDRRAPLTLPIAVERQRRYGDTSITIHRHQ